MKVRQWRGWIGWSGSFLALGIAWANLATRTVAAPPLVRPSGMASQEEFRRRAAERQQEFKRQMQERRQENLERARQAEEARLHYQATPGQTFAYSIDFSMEREDGTERLYGTPVFTVRTVEATGSAELLCVGKLADYLRLHGSQEFTLNPVKEVWLPTTVTLGKAEAGGTYGADLSAFPRLMGDLITPMQLIFVELPASATGHIRDEGSAELWTMTHNGFYVAEQNTTKGQVKLEVNAEPEDGGVVRLHKERSFHTTEGPRREWRYEGVSRFDRQRGLVLSCDGTYTHEEEGKPAEVVSITIRLLAGEDLAQAQAQAGTDWQNLPAQLQPRVFQRERLDVENLPRLHTVQETQPGMVVANCNNPDRHWYLADVVAVVSTYRVKVRYHGTGEEFEVHPGELAIPPADVKVIEPMTAPTPRAAKEAKDAPKAAAANHLSPKAPGAGNNQSAMNWLPYAIFGGVTGALFLGFWFFFGGSRPSAEDEGVMPFDEPE